MLGGYTRTAKPTIFHTGWEELLLTVRDHNSGIPMPYWASSLDFLAELRNNWFIRLDIVALTSDISLPG